MMYHYVREVAETEDKLGYLLSVKPLIFEKQLLWLQENGYNPIRMDELAECLRGKTLCPAKPIALTFDDGYDDAANIALPILQRSGFRATFYIVTNFVGKPGYMTWEQIELLRDSGMEIGSHTLNHRDLAVLSKEKAQEEITRSRQILEERLGVPVVSFCYPIGSYSPEVANLVQLAGYTNAVTTLRGKKLQKMYELPRNRLRGDEKLEGFKWYME